MVYPLRLHLKWQVHPRRERDIPMASFMVLASCSALVFLALSLMYRLPAATDCGAVTGAGAETPPT